MDSTTTGEGRSPGSRCALTREGSGDWREPGNSGYDPATPRGTGHQSQAGAELSLLPAVRQGLSGGHPGPCLCARQATRRCSGDGRRDVRGHRGSGTRALAGRRAGGPADGDLPPAARATGHDSETRRRGTATRDSDDSGPGGADGRSADSATDLRGRPGPHRLRLSAGAHGARGDSSRPPGAVRGADPGSGRGGTRCNLGATGPGSTSTRSRTRP
jgi:hypothetical protein